jgi:hypothetical protein
VIKRTDIRSVSASKLRESDRTQQAMWVVLAAVEGSFRTTMMTMTRLCSLDRRVTGAWSWMRWTHPPTSMLTRWMQALTIHLKNPAKACRLPPQIGNLRVECLARPWNALSERREEDPESGEAYRLQTLLWMAWNNPSGLSAMWMAWPPSPSVNEIPTTRLTLLLLLWTQPGLPIEPRAALISQRIEAALPTHSAPRV